MLKQSPWKWLQHCWSDRTAASGFQLQPELAYPQGDGHPWVRELVCTPHWGTLAVPAIRSHHPSTQGTSSDTDTPSLCCGDRDGWHVLPRAPPAATRGSQAAVNYSSGTQ